MTTSFGSGYLMYRGRKIRIVRNGQNAELAMHRYIEMPALHPFTPIKIQQLAKQVQDWDKRGKNRFAARVSDVRTGVTVVTIADIYSKFASVITAVKKCAGRRKRRKLICRNRRFFQGKTPRGLSAVLPFLL